MTLPDSAQLQSILEKTKTIAVVGFSSDPDRAGYYVPAYLQRWGYRIIPVNPNLSEGLGETAYASLTDIPEPVDMALIFRRSESVPPIVDEAVKKGVKTIWMQQGIVNEAAAEKARQAGVQVVMDRCMMIEHRRLRVDD